MKRREIMLKDLDRQIINQVGQGIYNYVTCLIALYIEDGQPKGQLLGSGTFIRCGSKYGILTAYHVVHSSLFQKSDRIGLAICRDVHSFSIPRKYLTVVDVGCPISEADGPDLSVILLGGSDISTIGARKSFWVLDKFRDEMMGNSINKDFGVYCLFGCPAEMETEEQPTHRYEETKGIYAMAGFSGVDREWSMGGFDYLDYVVSYDDASETPNSFEGVSGAGLWYILLKQKGKEPIQYNRPILCGVAYYQSNREENLRSIYCHGKKSIYNRVWNALLL